jgi:hypothetical protein
MALVRKGDVPGFRRPMERSHVLITIAVCIGSLVPAFSDWSFYQIAADLTLYAVGSLSCWWMIAAIPTRRSFLSWVAFVVLAIPAIIVFLFAIIASVHLSAMRVFRVGPNSVCQINLGFVISDGAEVAVLYRPVSFPVFERQVFWQRYDYDLYGRPSCRAVDTDHVLVRVPRHDGQVTERTIRVSAW